MAKFILISFTIFIVEFILCYAIYFLLTYLKLFEKKSVKQFSLAATLFSVFIIIINWLLYFTT